MPPPAWFDRDHDGMADAFDSSSESEDESQADDVTFQPGDIGIVRTLMRTSSQQPSKTKGVVSE